MQEFRLPRTGLDDFVFNGEAVVHVGGGASDARGADRWHEVTVYRTDRDTWVASIAYRSTFKGEGNNDYVEEVNDAEEIEPLLSLYNPEEHFEIPKSPAAQPQATATALKELVRRYDKLICDVLVSLPSSAPSEQRH